MRAAVVLFTRDLRVHDNPALAAAAREAEHVVPLFVLDDDILGRGVPSPNRAAFLAASLADLDASLRAANGRLVVARGDVVEEVMRVVAAAGAEAVFLADDRSPQAVARLRRLGDACAGQRTALRVCPGTTVVPAGAVVPAGKDHFAVFTPYWRRWSEVPLRPVEAPPARIAVPDVASLPLPEARDLVPGVPSPDLPAGGETAARARAGAWARGDMARYGDAHDALADDGTSRLSPYLRFGCISPVELVSALARREGGAPFTRQLCWRDFHHQLLAANPRIAREDYRGRGDGWPGGEDLEAAWAEGRTGYPIVDAGMRQLMREGWMHNRARLVTGSFLTKHLGVDWRRGARRFFELLADGEPANNIGNWQWVAGTGTDTRPNRILNPIAQALRNDPAGDYVRRYVPELASVPGPAVHQPWLLPPESRRLLDYPDRVVDHEQAARAFRARRSA